MTQIFADFDAQAKFYAATPVLSTVTVDITNKYAVTVETVENYWAHRGMDPQGSMKYFVCRNGERLSDPRLNAGPDFFTGVDDTMFARPQDLPKRVSMKRFREMVAAAIPEFANS